MKAPARTAGGARRRAGAAKPASLLSRAYEEIKERIITLNFLPGQYLNEGAISALLGLGRTPVHQALQRLHVEGLVEVMPRKGVIVLPDSIGEIIKILDSRLTVEPELARNAAAAAVTRADGRALRALAVATPERDGPPDIDRFTVDDRAFHRRVGELSGNRVMAEFARMLHERSTRYWYLHLWQTIDIGTSNRQHEAVAEAICAGDGEAAAAAMREHLTGLRARLEAIQAAKRPTAPPPRRRGSGEDAG